MKIDVLGVQAFVAVADHKSRAAGELSITQTALSRRLQNLSPSWACGWSSAAPARWP